MRGAAGFARRLGTRVTVALVTIPALLVAAGCSLLGGPSDASGAGGSGRPVVRVATAGLIDTAPFQIALSRGYFAAEGLDVVPTTVASGSDSVPRVVQGGLDVGFSNYATIFTAQRSGVGDFRIVADGARMAPDTMAVTTYPESGITSARDLAGRTLATNSPDDVPLLALRATLSAAGIDPGSLRVVVVHQPDAPQAMARHQIDAAIQPEPYRTQSVALFGARAVVDPFAAGGPAAGLPLDGYFTTASFARDHPQAVAGFARAMRRGATDAADRDTVTRVLPSYTRIDVRTAGSVRLPEFPTAPDVASLQRVADLMTASGGLPGGLDVASLVVAPPRS